MSLTDHATAVAHSFETCTDPECSEVLCGYYRAGLAAGHDFMRGTAAGLARVRADAQEEAAEAPES